MTKRQKGDLGSGDQLQNNLDVMEAGAGKVACRGARVNIGDIDEMVSRHLWIISLQNNN